MKLSFAALLLSGCVWLTQKPSAVLIDECSDCAEDQACDGGKCDDFCSSDTGLFPAPCVGEGYTCRYGSCELPCVDAECAHGYTCENYTNECGNYCSSDRQCQSDWHCCHSFSADCDYGTCVRD